MPFLSLSLEPFTPWESLFPFDLFSFVCFPFDTVDSEFFPLFGSLLDFSPLVCFGVGFTGPLVDFVILSVLSEDLVGGLVVVFALFLGAWVLFFLSFGFASIFFLGVEDFGLGVVLVVFVSLPPKNKII